MNERELVIFSIMFFGLLAYISFVERKLDRLKKELKGVIEDE